MDKKKRVSTKLIILIPVLVLGLVSIISNFTAVNNIRRVNRNATEITDFSMERVTRLASIEQRTQKIHLLGLSHIVATDLNTMIQLVDDIRAEQAKVEQELAEFEPYVDADTSGFYAAIVENYEGLVYESENLMAYSAAGNNEGAYSLANGAISDYSDAIDQNIEGVMGEFKQRTDTLKNSMNETAIFTKL